MQWILYPAVAGPASGYFWPNQAPAKFLAEFPDLANFSKAAVRTNFMVATNLEYSGISLNVENSGNYVNSVQRQGNRSFVDR